MTTSSTAARRLAAVEDLGAATRLLVQAVVDTEVDDATLARAAALAQEAATLLRSAVRPADQVPATDSVGPGNRLYSPVGGVANPVAPPARTVLLDAAAGRAELECTLHRVHEGPPTYGHGGMSAMLLDQVLGTAAALTGRTGLTRSLTVTYLRPVPLGEPLRLTGWITERSRSLIQTAGRITTAADPDAALVEAVGTFVVPRPDQLARLFGHVRGGRGGIPTGD